MKLEANHKVIVCLEAEELTRILSRTRTLSEKFQWERISGSLERFYSLPLTSYMTCILPFNGDSDQLEREVQAVRKVDPSFPLICLSPPEFQEMALTQMTGVWDQIIPKVNGWEIWLEKELRKLAEVKEREENYTSGGCLLASEMSLKAYNYQILEYYLNKYDGSVYEVARRLEIGKSTIYRMLKEQKEMKETISQ